MKSFFRVPQKVHHGLLLVTALAARFGDDRTTSLQEIAGAAGISQGFLEQVALPLSRAGIIIGRRGAGGGYRLAADPARLTVFDVLAAIEGPVSVMDCLIDKKSCVLADSCASRDVWMSIRSQLLTTLKNLTIAETAGIGHRRLKRHDAKKKGR